ncbi:MAG: PaaI family thioesterase [Acidimicrobiia bacterium]
MDELSDDERRAAKAAKRGTNSGRHLLNTKVTSTSADEVTGTAECPSELSGGPGVAHGGWTSFLFDEIMGHAANMDGATICVTTVLEVRYRKPVPVLKELTYRAWITKREGRRKFISAEVRLAANDTLLSEASGVWVATAPHHYEKLDSTLGVNP